MIGVPSSVDKFSVFLTVLDCQVKTGSDVKSVEGLLQSAEVVTSGVRMSCLCFLCVCSCVLRSVDVLDSLFVQL